MNDHIPFIRIAQESYFRKGFWERLRDWDWNLMDIVSYVFDIMSFYIHNLGWKGWIVVPAVTWLVMVCFRPTRYIASLVTVDIWRNTLANFIGAVFSAGGQGLRYGTGLMIARTREAARFFANLLK